MYSHALQKAEITYTLKLNAKFPVLSNGALSINYIEETGLNYSRKLC
jgi:hypothetical protein